MNTVVVNTVVVNIVETPKGWKTVVVVNGRWYGKQTVKQTRGAALIHVSQMLRVLAADTTEAG